MRRGFLGGAESRAAVGFALPFASSAAVNLSKPSALFVTIAMSNEFGSPE